MTISRIKRWILPTAIATAVAVVSVLGLALHAPAASAEALPAGKAFIWVHDPRFPGNNLIAQPRSVDQLGSAVVQTDGGLFHSLFRLADGTVWNWSHGDALRAPVRVQGIDNVVDIAAGFRHSLAVKSDGTVWAWGANEFGQLGDGTKNRSDTPRRVSGLTGVVQVSAGEGYSLALKSNGEVWSWGDNSVGQLGTGVAPATLPVQLTPVRAATPHSVARIVAGTNFAFALRSQDTGGAVFGWGENGAGNLGIGTTTEVVSTPTLVMRSALAIGAGHGTGYAVGSDNRLYSWGVNRCGALGDGSSILFATLPQPTSLTNVVRVDGGLFAGIALRSDGTVWRWGNSQDTEGCGSVSSIPVQVSGFTGASFVGVSQANVMSTVASSFTAQ